MMCLICGESFLVPTIEGFKKTSPCCGGPFEYEMNEERAEGTNAARRNY